MDDPRDGARVDRAVLRRYDRFAAAAADPALHLLLNPRMRVATVSSGYRRANFFVREDLDTRIYFHCIEDAVGYMARRGYSKMAREEEREWRHLLERAHKVVKAGAHFREQITQFQNLDTNLISKSIFEILQN